MIHKITKTILRTLAFALAMCATCGAWATVKPVAIWNGDFPESGNTSTRGGYILNLNGNTTINDAKFGKVVQIGDSSSGAKGGITVTNTTTVTKIAAIMGVQTNNLALTASSTGGPIFMTTCAGGGDNKKKDRVGVYYYEDGGTSSSYRGIWGNDYNASNPLTSISWSTTTGGTGNYPSDTGRHLFALTYFARSSNSEDEWSGTWGYLDSTTNAKYKQLGLRSGNEGVYGVNMAGMYSNGTTDYSGRNMTGATISYVVVLTGTVDPSDVSPWMLTGMTSAQTKTASEALTISDASVGLNLDSNGGTFTVNSDVSAAAVFVQDYAQTLKFSSGKLTAPILYVGNEATLTIDASEYDVSGLEDGDSIKIVDGVIYGSPTLVAPADTAEYLYNLFLGNDNGVYLSVQSANVELTSININFYMDRDGDKATYSAASKLTTAADVGLGGYAVPGNLWTEMAATDGTLNTLLAVDSENTKAYPVQVSATISGAYQTGWYTTGFTANADVRYGYIDDNDSATAPTITISNIPFDSYRVVVYHSPSSTYLGYDTVNGINLDYSAGNLGIGTSQWGAPSQIALAEGKNVLVSGVYTSSTLTIAAHKISDSARANIAAIQIIKDSVPTDDVAVSITKPSSDWDSLTLPTTAKLYGTCAASSSANEESFGNNSTYLQTLGSRNATVVVITNGVYTGINGINRNGETFSGTRDSYVIMSGGTTRLLKGRTSAKYSGGGTKATTGHGFTQLDGNAVVDYVFGAGDEAQNGSLTGNAGITLKGNAIVRGSVIGGWTSAHNSTGTVNGNTAVLVKNVQNNNTATKVNVISPGFIAGGSTLQSNVSSATTINGNTMVKVDLAANTPESSFTKTIVGGSLICQLTDSDKNSNGTFFGGSQSVSGSTSVIVNAPSAVTFSAPIVGGGYNGDENDKDNASVSSTSDASVTLTGGKYTSRIVAGAYATTSTRATVGGTATLTVNSGTIFNGATLDGGNANQTKKLVANTAIDTSTVTVTGFDALDVGAGVTQAAIMQASGEFAEITVHDGAQYTAATTTGTSDLRVVSSTDGGTKGIVVFDGLASTYTGDITIAGGAKAKLVSGTYTGTFTVESGATLEIDPGAAYTCAASFTGAGDVVVKSGTVTFTGANTLSNEITVDDGAIVVAAVTGDEGLFDVLSGGTLRLYVTTDQYRYEGNVFKGTNNGTVEYYHGTEADYSDYVKVTDSNSLNGNNLLPYYQIWKVVGDATEGNINTDANWPGASAVPTVRADETYGNAAFYVASGTVAVNIDATMNFSEIQVYGSGTVVFKSDGTHYLSAHYLSMTAGVNVQISGGEALKLSNGEIMAAQSSQTITINSGAKLSLDGINCTNKIVCNGTLETAGTTTLSSDNELAGNLSVTDGKTTIAFRNLYCGNWPDYAYINIASGSELEITSNNSIWSGGALGIYLKGTLTLDQSITLGTYTPIYLYPGASIGGTGTINLGESTYKNSTIFMYASGGDASALASISCPIALTSNSETGKIIVEDGVTLACSGTISAASGKSLTKQGTGTLDLTAITPSVPMTIDAGKVVADEVPTATITINENATFTLKDIAWAKGDADCFRGSGTLELYAATQEYGHDVEGVSFNGIVKVTNVSGKQNNFTGTAAMFTSAPEFVLNADNTHLGGGYYNNDAEHPFEVKNLSGAGTFKSEWNQYAHSYIIKTTQTKDTVFSGSFSSSPSTGDRVMNLTVVGDGSGTVHSLTLSSAQNASSSDTAQAASTLNISSDAKVVFTSSGGWGYGSVIIGNGGWLQSTNETAIKKLTLQSGSNLVLPTKTSQLTGISTISSSGTIKMHIADDTVPDVGDYLVDWSAAELSSAPSGNFLLVGPVAESLALEKDTTGLKAVAVVCTLTANGETIGYTSLNEALGALYMARNADKDAYITIKDGSTPSDETIATWAAGNIGWDSENSKFYVIVVAQIGSVKYLSLDEAITEAASSGNTITLLRDCSTENLSLGGKSITLDEGSYTFSGSFTGNGTLVLPSGRLLKSADTSMWAEGWVGTVWLKSITNIRGTEGVGTFFEPNKYGREGSVLKFSGIKGWILGATDPGATINPTIQLEDDDYGYGLCLSDGYGYNSNGLYYTNVKGLKGTGTLIGYGNAANVLLAVEDWDDFSGTLALTNKVVVFGTSTPTQSHIEGGGYIVVNSGESVEVPEGKTWTLGNGAIVYGDLSLGTGASIVNTTAANTWLKRGTGTVTLNSPSDLVGTPDSNWTGTVVLKSFDGSSGVKLATYGTSSDATIVIKGMTAGWLDSYGDAVGGYTASRCPATLQLDGAMNITGLSSSWHYIFSKITGTGSISFPSGGSARELTITTLEVPESTSGVAVTNNTSTTLSIGTLALPAGTSVAAGTKLLTIGGSGSFSVDSVKVGSETQTLPLVYTANDGIYVGVATYNGTGYSTLAAAITDAEVGTGLSGITVYAGAVAPAGYYISGSSVLKYQAAKVTPGVTDTIVYYETLAGAVADADIESYIEVLSGGGSATSTNALIYVMPNDYEFSITSSYAGFGAYTRGDAVPGLSGVYRYGAQAHAATFVWNPIDSPYQWSKANNWTSDDGDVSSCPNNLLYTVEFNSDVAVIVDMATSVGTIKVGANVSFDDELAHIMTIGTGGIVFTSKSARLTVSNKIELSGVTLSTTVPGGKVILDGNTYKVVYGTIFSVY